MSPSESRELVSTGTHLLGLAAAFPITWLLVRAAMRTPATDPAAQSFKSGKVASLAIFGFGMVACYAGSAAFHGIPADESGRDLLRRLDLVGIFLLIAGTFTPAAWSLMRPAPRRVAMVVVWGVAITCAGAVALGRAFPTWLATSIYLGLGWGMALCYADIRRSYDRRTLRLLPIGGALYSVGAIVNLTRSPGFFPGVGSHEVFHLFVLAGTAAHVAFLFQVVVPAQPPSLREAGLSAESRTRSERSATIEV